jgi:hypothetical protein
MDVDLHLKKMKEFLESDRGKELRDEFIRKHKREAEREDQVAKVILGMKKKEFDEKFSEFLKWERKKEEYYYDVKHVMTSTNLFNFVLKAFQNIGKPIKSDEIFFCGGWKYKNYQIKVYCGQGSFYVVSKDGEEIFHST